MPNNKSDDKQNPESDSQKRKVRRFSQTLSQILRRALRKLSKAKGKH